MWPLIWAGLRMAARFEIWRLHPVRLVGVPSGARRRRRQPRSCAEERGDGEGYVPAVSHRYRVVTCSGSAASLTYDVVEKRMRVRKRSGA